MIIVIGMGTVISALAYLFGFIFVVYILEKIVTVLNDAIAVINHDISLVSNIYLPMVSHFNIEMFVVLLSSAFVALTMYKNYTKHENENNETVYKKDWQKLLAVVNVAMIYPIFTFFGNSNIVDNRQKIIMLGYAVLFLIVFVFSNNYKYISNNYSMFDKFCHCLFSIIVFFSFVLFAVLTLGIYSSVIYLHDFVFLSSVLFSIFYYAFLTIPAIIYTFTFFPTDSGSLKNIISKFIFLIIFTPILGFSPFYNLFVLNSSVYSIHSLILIDIVLVFTTSTILLPVKIKKAVTLNKKKS
jgi:hypothetical protein